MIDQYVRVIKESNRRWEGYFRHYRLKVLALCYEDFVKQYESTIRAVLDYLEIAHQDQTVILTRLQRQADTRSLER